MLRNWTVRRWAGPCPGSTVQVRQYGAGKAVLCMGVSAVLQGAVYIHPELWGSSLSLNFLNQLKTTLKSLLCRHTGRWQPPPWARL